MQKRTFYNKKGFTLVELLIVLGLLSVVLGVGYNFYFSTTRSFATAETQWIIQRDIRQVAEFLTNELRYAYQLDLTNAAVPGKPTKNDNYIFLDDKSNTYKHRYTDEKNNDYEKTIIDADKCTISFSRVKQDTEIGTSNIPNTIFFKVASKDIDYEITSQVTLLNMPKGNIEGESGKTIKYTKTTVEEIKKDPPKPPRGCFIATAAFGSEYQPSVLLLRDFRDNYLLTNKVGTKFVNFYYQNSPPIADYIKDKELLKFITRIILLPIIGMVLIIEHPYILLITLLLLFYHRLTSKPGERFLG